MFRPLLPRSWVEKGTVEYRVCTKARCSAVVEFDNSAGHLQIFHESYKTGESVFDHPFYAHNIGDAPCPDCGRILWRDNTAAFTPFKTRSSPPVAIPAGLVQTELF